MTICNFIFLRFKGLSYVLIRKSVIYRHFIYCNKKLGEKYKIIALFKKIKIIITINIIGVLTSENKLELLDLVILVNDMCKKYVEDTSEQLT